MRFVVRSGVKSNDLHELGCRGIGGKKQGAGSLTQFQSFQPFKSFPMFNSDSRTRSTREQPRNVREFSFNATESLPSGKKWPINDFNKFLGPESHDVSGFLSASNEEYFYE